MKIRTIRLVNHSVYGQRISCSQKEQKVSDANNFNIQSDLKCMPVHYPLTFSGGSDIAKVRKLFAYGIPDMYSPRITIDPKIISKWLRNGFFNRPASEVLKILDNSYAGSFIENEANALSIIRGRAKLHPDYTMREILQEVRPVYSRILRKEQTPVLHKLWEKFQILPDEYKEQFWELLQRTDKMLNDKPVVIPFSSYEFKYKLAKIKEYVDKGEDKKASRVMSKLMKESMRFSNSTNADNMQYQKDIFNFLNHIRKRSVLKNHEHLKMLFQESKSRLDRKETFVPFGKKSFLYDLHKIIQDLPESESEEILKIARQLPSSGDNFAAYILKISTDSNDRLGYRLTWPSMATIEHLHPRSMGGTDDYWNLGIASAIENSDRKSIDFVEQLERRPKTPECTQKTIDKLIELYNEGVFEQINLTPKYITGYSNTVKEQSKNKLIIDTAKFSYNE